MRGSCKIARIWQSFLCLAGEANEGRKETRNGDGQASDQQVAPCWPTTCMSCKLSLGLREENQMKLMRELLILKCQKRNGCRRADKHVGHIMSEEFKVYANIPLDGSFNMSDKQTMTAKSVLRKQLYSILKELPEREIMRQSKAVTDKITENEAFKKARVVSIYLSMEKEIQTDDLVRHIFKEGKECFIPRFRPGNPVMEMIRLSSMEQYHSLAKNEWNIKQPPDDEQIESVFDRGQLDVVLAPGLAFTRKGDRLGRGKGYYDRFLARCKRELPSFPCTMGLAFTEQILPEIPTDQYDFPLDLVVSPQ